MTFVVSLAIIILLFEMCYILKLKKHLKKINDSADHDSLTGAYNRQGFIKRADKILSDTKERKDYCILFFNIKGFKAINEIFGVDAGDKVLRQSVDLLEASSLQPILTGRLEADHFVCLFEQSRLNYDELVRLCHRIYVEKDKQFNFYGRCGIYMINDLTIGVSGMCDRAKLAKESIVDDYAKPYAVYDKSMRDGFVTKKELASELQRALKNHEFKVFYQPIYDAKTKQIISAEALVRWQHTSKGLISPGIFIPVFEENGAISELDLYVGGQTFEFLHQRISQHKFAVPIAVNLSRMDFYNRQLMEMLIYNISEAKLPMGYSRIEITESAYVSLAENNSEILDKIKKLGIKILLDDFGSGYSSLSSIQDFDFDIIKLDIGFIQQIGMNEKTERIIQSVIDMAHHIGAKVVAEGVETQRQYEFLLEQNCDYIQGYYFSRPLSQFDFATLLDER